MLRLLAFFIAFSVISAQSNSQVQLDEFPDTCGCDYLIVTPEKFLTGAKLLANHRNAFTPDNIGCARVVTLETIYEEFTSLQQEPACELIRRALNRAYIGWRSLKYVVLIGDERVSWDEPSGRPISKGIMPSYLKGYSIVYHDSRLDTLFDFSDDFYLSFTQNPPAISIPEYDARFCIGRIPCETVEQCSLYVEKVIKFDSSPLDQQGWRNNVLVLADDSHQNDAPDPLGFSHFTSAEQVSEQAFRGFFKFKVYMSAYRRKSGERPFSALSQAVSDLQKGALWTVYFGHASPIRMADEGFLIGADASQLKNNSMPTVIFSFSCMNGSYQNRIDNSMCKQFLFAQGGALVYFGSTTLEYAGSNDKLAGILFQTVDLLPQSSLGMITLKAKMTTRKNNVYHYQYLGDPALRLLKKRINLILKLNENGEEKTFRIKPENSLLDKGLIRYTTAVRETVHLLDDSEKFFVRDSLISTVESNFLKSSVIQVYSSLRRMKLNAHVWNDTVEGFLDTVVDFNGLSTAFCIPNKKKEILFAINGSVIKVTNSQNFGAHNWEITICDLLGRVVKRIFVPQMTKTAEINLAKMRISPGNYVLSVKAGKELLETKTIYSK